MGRKSSAKSQTRPASSAPGAPPDQPRGSSARLLTIAVLVVAAGIGVFVATRPSANQPAPAAAAAPQPPPDAVPAMAHFGPHKQDRYPPLPFDPAPARPPDVVRAAYLFAAEHPEVLGYVPCYCGCERTGHRGNDDCFITARDANGDVTEWEPHGMT
jgi:uncharacterized protein with PCYCGC motif